MKPRWKSVVELVVGIVASLWLSLFLSDNIINGEILWIIVDIIALLFWTNLVRNAWSEL